MFINGEALSGLENNEKITVVIQDVAAMGGVGGSFTVGISQGKKFFGLCYELQERHAKEVAGFIAENLGYEIESREAVFFPLFNLH